MSRSYKHHPVSTCMKTRGMKRIFNRRVRRVFDVPSGNWYRKMSESWDICDYKSYISRREWAACFGSERLESWEHWYLRK